MTQENFTILEQADQIEHLYSHGVYVGKIKEGSKTVILYQLESFYVEVFYKRYRYVIDRIQCFSSVDKLDPYLMEINMMELISW